jgi:hypothetical protein
MWLRTPYYSGRDKDSFMHVAIGWLTVSDSGMLRLMDQNPIEVVDRNLSRGLGTGTRRLLPVAYQSSMLSQRCKS